MVGKENALLGLVGLVGDIACFAMKEEPVSPRRGPCLLVEDAETGEGSLFGVVFGVAVKAEPPVFGSLVIRAGLDGVDDVGCVPGRADANGTGVVFTAAGLTVTGAAVFHLPMSIPVPSSETTRKTIS